VEAPIGLILQDFAVIMIVASVMTLIFYKLKQPVVIGFIVAGIIIGPYSPPFSLIHNLDVLNLFAELGVILLLFTVGMEFPIQKLRDVGRKAIIIASSEAFGTLIIGFIVALSLGLGFYDSLFIALAISVTSTVIIMRVLGELNMMKEYMALEKARYGSRLELETVIKGEVGNRQIAPLLLLPFIENSFKHCSNEAEQPWINLQISLENETLLMKLINGVALGYEEPCNSVHEIINIEKRLQLLYPGKYELKRYVENEIYIVLLKINLGEGFRPEYPVSKVINGPILKTDYAIR